MDFVFTKLFILGFEKPVKSKYQHYLTPNKIKDFYYYKLAKNSFLRIVKLDLSHNSKTKYHEKQDNTLPLCIRQKRFYGQLQRKIY